MSRKRQGIVNNNPLGSHFWYTDCDLEMFGKRIVRMSDVVNVVVIFVFCGHFRSGTAQQNVDAGLDHTLTRANSRQHSKIKVVFQENYIFL